MPSAEKTSVKFQNNRLYFALFPPAHHVTIMTSKYLPSLASSLKKMLTHVNLSKPTL